MALILNIESATAWCSVALGKDGKLFFSKKSEDKFEHSSQLTLMIEALMTEAELSLKGLDAIAVSQGPGSFTALRVGMSTAKGICFALDKPLIGVATLQAYAQGLILEKGGELKTSQSLICPMIDARRMEVYTNLYKLSLEPLGEDKAMIIDEKSFQDFFLSGQSIIFTGDGCEKCQNLITNPLARFVPSIAIANHMVPLAEKAYNTNAFLDLAYASPFYLKPPNITTPKKLL